MQELGCGVSGEIGGDGTSKNDLGDSGQLLECGWGATGKGPVEHPAGPVGEYCQNAEQGGGTVDSQRLGSTPVAQPLEFPRECEEEVEYQGGQHGSTDNEGDVQQRVARQDPPVKSGYKCAHGGSGHQTERASNAVIGPVPPRRNSEHEDGELAAKPDDGQADFCGGHRAHGQKGGLCQCLAVRAGDGVFTLVFDSDQAHGGGAWGAGVDFDERRDLEFDGIGAGCQLSAGGNLGKPQALERLHKIKEGGDSPAIQSQQSVAGLGGRICHGPGDIEVFLNFDAWSGASGFGQQAAESGIGECGDVPERYDAVEDGTAEEGGDEPPAIRGCAGCCS